MPKKTKKKAKKQRFTAAQRALRAYKLQYKKRRLVTILSSIFVVYMVLYGVGRVQQYMFRRDIDSFARAFVALAEEIETTTGEQVTVGHGCFTTQEVFGDGKTSCTASVKIDRFNASPTATATIVQKIDKMKTSELISNKDDTFSRVIILGTKCNLSDNYGDILQCFYPVKNQQQYFISAFNRELKNSSVAPADD